MTNEEKSSELGKKYKISCYGVGDCEFEARQVALEAMVWKDEQFAEERQKIYAKSAEMLVSSADELFHFKDEQFTKQKQALIDKACDLFCKAHCHGKSTCPMVIESCEKFNNFRTAMEE